MEPYVAPILMPCLTNSVHLFLGQSFFDVAGIVFPICSQGSVIHPLPGLRLLPVAGAALHTCRHNRAIRNPFITVAGAAPHICSQDWEIRPLPEQRLHLIAGAALHICSQDGVIHP